MELCGPLLGRGFNVEMGGDGDTPIRGARVESGAVGLFLLGHDAEDEEEGDAQADDQQGEGTQDARPSDSAKPQPWWKQLFGR